MGEPQVLIAGAGPTGLVLALWLAKAEVPFRLIDRKAGPGEGSRAMVIQARTLEFYRQLGIADDVITKGFKVDRFRFRNESGERATIPLGEAGKGESRYPFALSFPQDDHERLLIDRLSGLGHAVEWNTELTGLSQHPDGVRAVLRAAGGEATWDGQYLCGCDGAHSAVRHGIDVGFPGGTYEQLFFVADAAAEGDWSEHDINAYIAQRTFCIVFPVRTAGMFRFIGLVPESLQGRDNIVFDDLRAGVEQVTGTRVKQVNWFATYRVHHRVADHFRQGRVFLAGDAGHVHSPVGGQGMNTGIGDAVNLAWKLAAVLGGRGTAELLDSYEPERIPFARTLVATTDRAFEALVGRGVLSRLVRKVIFPHFLPFAMRFAAFRRAQFRFVSQTRISYRTSPLSDGSAGSVHAGDRLPWVEGGDNFAPLKSRDWQIHIYGTPTTGLREFAASSQLPLHEFPWTEAARHAGLEENALYLVRPDGHIGFARKTQDIEALKSYIDRFGLVEQTVP